MFDARVRPHINPPLDWIAYHLACTGISANTVTFVGFLLGLMAMISIYQGDTAMGGVFFLFNRLCDGIDGAIARYKGMTDFGGFLDIVCDFIIYAGIVFAFGMSRPENLPAACFLIFSFIGPIASFLAYAIVAAKKNITCVKRGVKSFYYLGGICEGTETACTLLAMCAFPEYFAALSIAYGLLCWITTAGRTYAAWNDFK